MYLLSVTQFEISINDVVTQGPQYSRHMSLTLRVEAETHDEARGKLERCLQALLDGSDVVLGFPMRDPQSAPR